MFRPFPEVVLLTPVCVSVKRTFKLPKGGVLGKFICRGWTSQRNENPGKWFSAGSLVLQDSMEVPENRRVPSGWDSGRPTPL